MKLACRNTYRIRIVVGANSGAICLLIFFMILISNIVILNSLKSHSSEGWCQISTCGSHFTVVVLFLCLVYSPAWILWPLTLSTHVGDCVLWNPHSHVKSYHFYSEKHGGEKMPLRAYQRGAQIRLFMKPRKWWNIYLKIW